MDDGSGPTLDAGRLARAVEDLIRAIDPSLTGTRVEIEVTRGQPSPAPQRNSDPQVSPAAQANPTPGPSSQALAASPPDSAPGGENDLELDLAGRTLSVDGHLVTLTRREFDLLAYLQDRRGVALSRRELMGTVWQTGYLIGDRTIDVHVRRLRVKLGRHADRLSTLRGFGYRLD